MISHNYKTSNRIMPFNVSAKTLTLFAIFLSVSLAIDCNFDNYIQQFKKPYQPGSDQYNYRSLIYAANCTNINAVNNDPASTYTLKESKCTDLTESECQSQFNLRYIDLSKLPSIIEVNPHLTVSSASDAKVSATPPSTLNYNTLGKVTAVKNQGSCGCCWAFASIAAYESWLLIKGFNIGLSEEASLECTYLYAVGRRMSNCTQGYITDAMDYLGYVGGVLRSTYPYTSGSISSGMPASTPGICTEKNRIYLGNGTTQLYTTLTTTQIKQKLTDDGPQMVGIYANAAFMSYSGGIFSGCPANSANYINHAVELIGYDASNNWIVKNQWDTTWGSSGFMTVSNALDCGLSKVIIGMSFSSYNSNVTVSLDPTLYMTKSQPHCILTFIIMIVLVLLL